LGLFRDNYISAALTKPKVQRCAALLSHSELFYRSLKPKVRALNLSLGKADLPLSPCSLRKGIFLGKEPHLHSPHPVTAI